MIKRTIHSAVVFAALTLIQGSARAEEPWRFITLADWHMAEVYVQPSKYPVAAEATIANLKMLKAQYGGELVMLSGDSNVGHWDTEKFIKSFKPGLTPAESILQAGKLCYSGMVKAFEAAGYSRLLMAVGDHELGDNPWPVGTAVSKYQPQFREAFANVFNINPDNGQFIYDKPIGKAAISNSGKFRVFVLMGQSNMAGAARAAELESPYNEKHDRIRIWANGRLTYVFLMFFWITML